MSALNIELAQCRYRFTGMTAEQASRVRARFGGLETEARTADVEISVALSGTPDDFIKRPPGPVEYQVAVHHTPTAVEIEGIGFRAHIERGTLRTVAKTCLEDDWFTGGFENLFRVLTSYRLFSEGSLVLHSAAFTDGHRGFLFCGRSGAGKTTLCELADALGLDVLSDELNAVRVHGRRLSLLAMPFAGDFGRAPANVDSFPLTGLLGLRKSAEARVDVCSRAQAVSRIVAACPYVNVDPLCADPLTEQAGQLVDRLPMRLLSFAKDKSFWKVLDGEYAEPQSAISA
jgi:hypothetical protein